MVVVAEYFPSVGIVYGGVKIMGAATPKLIWPEVPIANTRFVSGVHSINEVGGHIQVTFYRDEVTESGKIARLVLNSPQDILTMPSGAVPDAIGKAMVAIGRLILSAPTNPMRALQ